MKIDPKANIIMCSALGYEEVVQECVEAGAKAFIVKPFNKEQVEETIAKVLDES